MNQDSTRKTILLVQKNRKHVRLIFFSPESYGKYKINQSLKLLVTLI